MSHEDTTEVGPSPRRRRAASAQIATGLVVVWAPDDPAALGAFTPVAGATVFGRSAETVLLRQRPGQDLPAPGLTSPRISRQQLRLGALSGGRLSVENVGRAPLRLKGERVAQGVVGPGDLVEIGERMLLLCVSRPCPLPLPLDGVALEFPWAAPDAAGLVGESPALWALRGSIGFVGPRPGHVLVLGLSGSGKELVAAAIHQHSPRAARTMIARNAATLPPALIDAELFGHARNYPNAGMPERPGLVGEADGSTLFLDEIGELPEAQQSHLLRVLDGGEYQRLGESRPRRADLRLIAATNRSPESLKPDFLARFRHVVEVPPLRDRREDLPLLVRHLLRRAARDDARLAARFLMPAGEPGGDGEPRVSAELVEAVLRHPLPLQIRELDALLWRALARSIGDVVELCEALPVDPGGPGGSSTDPADVDVETLRAAVVEHGGVQEKIWRALGLQSRYVLRRLLKKHGLES